MKRLELYADNPFENLAVGRNKLLAFFKDHAARLKKQISLGKTEFAPLYEPYAEAVKQLEESNEQAAVTLVHQKSKTRALNAALKEFKTKAFWLHPIVKIKFPKRSSGYLDFFPHLITPIHRANKTSFGSQLVNIIHACEKHKDDFDQDLKAVFEKIQSDYKDALQEQTGQKASLKRASLTWNECLSIVEDLAHKNALTIAIVYRRQPKRVKAFFNQSMITHHKKRKKTEKTEEE